MPAVPTLLSGIWVTVVDWFLKNDTSVTQLPILFWKRPEPSFTDHNVPARGMLIKCF